MKDKQYVDIRTWYRNRRGDEQWLPGKGISVPVEQFDKVMALLDRIKQVEEPVSSHHRAARCVTSGTLLTTRWLPSAILSGDMGGAKPGAYAGQMVCREFGHRLAAFRGNILRNRGRPMPSHPLQLIKAPKSDSPYAEY